MSQNIIGVIFDFEKKTPIPYANIYLNQYSGAVSNINGEFNIHIKNIELKDTIWISCIGYISKPILLFNLDITKVNEIFLIPAIYNLKTFEVSELGIEPYDILKDALNKININCELYRKFYKGTYFEQITEYSKNRGWYTRTVNSALVTDDPGYDKQHNVFKENIYFIGINKNKEDSIMKTTYPLLNYLEMTLEYNLLRYKNDFFPLKNDFIYKIKSNYYDSILKTDIIEIKIIPTNSKKEQAGYYGEVYMSISDHKIYKIHLIWDEENPPPQKKSNDKDY